MTALGQRIKAFRAERALQQRQLAEKAGLTPSMLSQIESGRLTPSLPTLGKLAGALGVSIASLFGADWTSARHPQGRLSGGFVRRLIGAMARVGSRALPG
jgi:transcriptional regulator with XRE-family HTH domain